jgi:hypothetical protein
VRRVPWTLSIVGIDVEIENRKVGKVVTGEKTCSLRKAIEQSSPLICVVIN